MRRLAILASAAALAMLTACQQPAPPRPIVNAAAGPPEPCGRPVIGDGMTFVKERVRMLYQDPSKPNFEDNFTTRDTHIYYPPEMYVAPLPEHAQDVAAAFDAAPASLKNDLSRCIDVAFIDPTKYSAEAPFGWSFWEVTNKDQTQRSGTGRYVALGGRLWSPNSDGTKFGLEDLEKLILTLLSGTSDWKVQAQGPALIDPHRTAIIAVLAREVGLSLNHDFVRRGRICPRGTDFWTVSWNPISSESGMIRKLAERFPGESPIRPYPSLAVIRKADLRSAERDLAEIFGLAPLPERRGVQSANSSEWASLLGSVSPDDDFAEIYTLLALRSAGVTSLMLTLPGGQQVDLIKNLNAPGPYLGQKVACVTTALPGLTGAPRPPAPAPR